MRVQVIREPNSSKSLGMDDIGTYYFTSRIITKYWRNTSFTLFEMVKRMYEYQGLVFEDFTRSKTFLIPKNGNLTDYNNYRSISLLTHASKKLQQIIKIGLKEKLKK